MKLSLLAIVASALFLPSAFGAAVVVSQPASGIGGALADGIVKALGRRGFAANDPRVFQTVAAVAADVEAVAVTAGSGATWLTLASRLNWVAGTVALIGTGYSIYKWYVDTSAGVKFSLQTIAPAYPGSSAIGVGQVCYYAIGSYIPGGSGPCSASPDGALLEGVLSNYMNGITVSSVTYYNLTSVYDSSSKTYQWIPSGIKWVDSNGATRTDSTFVNKVFQTTAPIACPVNTVISSGACVASKINSATYNPSSTSATAVDPSTAYANLPAALKSDQINAALIAALANASWRHAASQPGYKGVPINERQPVLSGDVQPTLDLVNTKPKVSDLSSPVVSTAVPHPVVSTETNPDLSNVGAGGTVVDLGPDPGIGVPTIEDSPTGLFGPIQSLLTPWLSWSAPTHSATCPTWHAAPSIGGNVFNIDIVDHCSLFESNRTIIYNVAFACWLLMAAFIVFSA